ncbi:TorD/DmsD family molecular chaperone [Salinilacihabitans rarus]|uniref:TorD/DmsD family molecular chaperone n=1 Tax=Salinilacihabitans rarus TaxID=2961596 RepID=UPI0020C92928|nr:molecular chaperone TorD family protein [Salinilacihabitans rarus]
MSATGRNSAEPADGDVARARSDLYGLLAAAFDGDIDVLAAALRDGSLVDVAAALPVDLDASALDCEDVDEEALSIAYDNRFVVPGSRYVPPFASAHRGAPSASFESDSRFRDGNEAGELLGDPAARMSALYERAGFRPEHGDFPDHVAAQFEFLAATAAEEARRAARGDEEGAATLRDLQRETLSQLGWLDAFHEAVEDVDDEGVFAALVALARTAAAWHARDVGASTR